MATSSGFAWSHRYAPLDDVPRVVSIRWTEFLHGKVSVEIAAIQNLHCVSSPSCQITGADWMKTFISHLLQTSHSQWIFRNYTLHDKQRGYLRLRLCKEVLREIHELLETPPSEVPPEHQYLLELDHSAMYKASYEEQAYWVLAMKAARRAGRRAATSQRVWGRSQRTRVAANRETRIRYDFHALEDQMGYKLCGQKPGRKRPYLTSVSASVGSNKRLWKPDWQLGAPAQYVDTLKLRPQLAPGEITRRDNHLLPQAAMLYGMSHIWHFKRLLCLQFSLASRTVNF